MCFLKYCRLHMARSSSWCMKGRNSGCTHMTFLTDLAVDSSLLLVFLMLMMPIATGYVNSTSFDSYDVSVVPIFIWYIISGSSSVILQIVRPIQDSSAKQGESIKTGSLIRLQHMKTRKWLHSHLHASPISGNMEVSRCIKCLTANLFVCFLLVTLRSLYLWQLNFSIQIF